MAIRTPLIVGLFFLASCLPSPAANTTHDFESLPNAEPDWQIGAIASGFGGWTFSGGSAEITSAQSVSGQQSLVFSTTAAAASLSNSPGLTETTRFLDLRLRLSIGQTLAAGTSPSWSLGQAQLVLDSLPAMVVRSGTSPTAQIYLYSSASSTWGPVGPALELEDNGLALKQWVRLTVRTDSSGGIADLWINGSLVAINHPVTANTLSSFAVNLDPVQFAAIDDFTSGPAHPLYPDADHDGIPDLYEYENGLDASANDRDADHDNDALDNLTEYWLGTKSNASDSDGDVMPDAWEYEHGLNPASASDKFVDSDLDGYTNWEEFNASTDPSDANENGGSVVYVRAGATGNQGGTMSDPFATIQAAVGALPLSGGRIVLLGAGGNFTGLGNVRVTVDRPVTILGRQGATISGGVADYGFITTNPTTPPPNPGPLTIEDVAFVGLGGGSDGSAVYSDQVPLVLRRCTFDNCTCIGTTGDDGGAVFINGATLEAEDCAFRSCTSKDKGGALYAEYAVVTVRRCRFLTCHSTTGDGSAIYLSGASGTIENSLVHACTIYTSGQGAIACGQYVNASLNLDVPTTVVFKYCTLLSNKVPTVTGNTAGLYNANATGADPITLNSCILWDNKLNSNAKSQLNGFFSPATPAYTSLWSPTYCKFDALTWPGTGHNNNTTSPSFLTGTPLMSLAATSTNGLAGDPATAPSTDVDGTPRTAVATAERGCYEFAETDGDGMSSAWELKYGFNPNDKADALLDFDQDGYTNSEEYLRQSDPKVAATADTSGSIYVDPVIGNNTTPGTGTFAAPVKSLSRAFELVTSSGRTRICLRNGTYSGALNRNITFVTPTSNCLIKAINPGFNVTVDLGNAGRFLSITNSSVTNYGYTTTGQLTLQSLVVRNGKVPVDGVGGDGGAVCLASGPSGLVVNGCRFVACNAARGGAIYDAGVYPAAGSGSYSSSAYNCLSISSTEFAGCEATEAGGAVLCNENGRIIVTGSTFAYNAAHDVGGAILTKSYRGMSISGCLFFRNQATSGGAIHVGNMTGTTSLMTTNGFQNWIVNCDFTENIAYASGGTTLALGGGLALWLSSTDVHNCRFTANLAAAARTNPASGGALYLASGAPKIFGSIFSANESSAAGGGAYIGAAALSGGGTPVLANCAFKDNAAGIEGGAIATAEVPTASPTPAATIAHCTLVWNRAPSGTAIYYRSATNLYDNLIWFNSYGSGSGSASLEGPGALVVAGNNLSTSMTGNVSIRPTLAFDNFHLAGPLPPTIPHLVGTSNSTYVSWISEAYPSASSSGYSSYYDIDLEPRYSSDISMEAGCDELRDTDIDGLPDWFENYIINYSGTDTYNSMDSVTRDVQLWNSQWTIGEMFNYGGDPRETDSNQPDHDNNGVGDVEEKALSDHTPGTSNPAEKDTDGDGLTDAEESDLQTNVAAKDSDNDGVWDGNEEHPNDQLLTFALLGEPHYIAFDIGEGKFVDLNNKGQVLYYKEVPDTGSSIAGAMKRIYFRWSPNKDDPEELEVENSHTSVGVTPKIDVVTTYTVIGDDGTVGGTWNETKTGQGLANAKLTSRPVIVAPDATSMQKLAPTPGPDDEDPPPPCWNASHSELDFTYGKPLGSVRFLDKNGIGYGSLRYPVGGCFMPTADYSQLHAGKPNLSIALWPTGTIFPGLQTFTFIPPGQATQEPHIQQMVNEGVLYAVSPGGRCLYRKYQPTYQTSRADSHDAPSSCDEDHTMDLQCYGVTIKIDSPPNESGIFFHQQGVGYTVNVPGVTSGAQILPPVTPSENPEEPRAKIVCVNDMNLETVPGGGKPYNCGMMIGGSFDGNACYWVKKNGQWQKKFIEIEGQGSAISGEVVQIQDDGAMWVKTPPDGSAFDTEPQLWKDKKLLKTSSIMEKHASTLNASVVAKRVTTKGIVGCEDGGHVKVLLPYFIKMHPVVEGVVQTKPETISASRPSPVIEIPQAAGCSINNLHFNANGEIRGDIVVSGTVTSAVCDMIAGEEGTIDEIHFNVNHGAGPGPVPFFTVPCTTLSKETAGDVIGKPFKYIGSFNGTIPDVPLTAGNNILMFTARDKIYNIPGFSTWRVVVELQDPVGAGGSPQIYPEAYFLRALLPSAGLDPSAVDTIAVSYAMALQGSPASLLGVADSRDDVTLHETEPNSRIFSDGVGAERLVLTLSGELSADYADVLTANLQLGNAGAYLELLIGESGELTYIFEGSESSVGVTGANGQNPTGGADQIPYPPPTLSINGYPGIELIEKSNGGEFRPYVMEMDGPNLKDFYAKITWKSAGKELKLEESEEQTEGLKKMILLMEADHPSTPAVASFVADAENSATDDEDAKIVASMRDASFVQGFTKGMGTGAMKMVGGFEDTISGTLHVVGSRLAVLSGYFIHVKLLGDESEDTIQTIIEIVEPIVEENELFLQTAEMLQSSIVEYASIQGQAIDEAVVVMLTGNSDGLPNQGAAAKASELNKAILANGAEMISGFIQSLNLTNKTDGQKGYILGRLCFEISSYFLPIAAANGLTRVSKLGFLETLLPKLKAKKVFSNISKATEAECALLKAELATSGLCFVAGTKVHCKQGIKNIEEITVADMVLSRDEITQTQGWQRVLEVSISHPQEIFQLTYKLRGPPSQLRYPLLQTLGVTSGHPFWVSNRSVPGFIPVRDLKLGDVLALANGGEAEVVGMTAEFSATDQVFTTYNLNVDQFHTYFVGEAGVWVHNSCPAKDLIVSVFQREVRKLLKKPDYAGKSVHSLRFNALLETKKAFNITEKKTLNERNWWESSKEVSAKMIDDFKNGKIPNVNDLPTVRDWNDKFFADILRGKGIRDGVEVHHIVPEQLVKDLQKMFGITLNPKDVPGLAYTQEIHRGLSNSMKYIWSSSEYKNAPNAAAQIKIILRFYENHFYDSQAAVLRAFFAQRNITL